MSDLNTEIKIGADASGVEAGVGKAKRSLKDLGDAAQKAGKDAGAGIGSIGAGGDKAAKDIARSTKNMQSELQRLLATHQAGAKGSREYYEALADTRGISRNAIKPILDQIDAAKTKTLQAKAAADSWQSSFSKIGPAVAVAFSGAAITAFLGKVVSVQREFDVLNSSLKTVTGSSAAAEREMAWLKDFAKETPFGLAQATQGFVKMKALGLDPTRAALTSFGNTASAMGKDLNQMIEAVADASTGEFERLKEFGIKAKKEGDNVSLTFQGVTTTIGNSAREITKYLEDIGNNSFGGAMEERAKTLDGTIAALGDTWDELFRTVSTNNVGSLIFDSVTLANGALEDATTILRALGGAAQDAGRDTGALSTIQSGLATAFETVAVLGANVAYVLKQTGNEIGGLVAQIAQFAKSGGGAFMLFDVITKGRSVELDAIRSIRKEMVADAEEARRQIDATEKRILGARSAIAEYNKYATRNASAATDPRRVDLGGSAPRATGGVSSGTAKAVKETISEYDKLIKKLSDELPKAAAEAEAAQMGYNKAQAEFLALAGSGVWAKFTSSQRANVAALFESKIASEQAADATRTLAKGNTEAAQARERYLASLETGLDKIQADIAAQIEATERMGLTKEAIADLDAAKLEMLATDLELQAIKAMDRNLDQQTYDALKQQAQAYRDLGKAKKAGAAKDAALDMEKANAEAAKKAQEDWERAAADIERSLTDSLMRGFESGKDFAKNLRDTVINMFKTMVLRPVISAIVNPVAGAVTSALGLSGAQGGGNSIMGGIQTASNLNSLYGAGSQALFGGAAGASAASLGYANIVGMAGGDAIGALAAANGMWAGVATGAQAAAQAAIASNAAMAAGTAAALPAGTTAAAAGAGAGAGGASGALAAIPGWGWALAGVAALGMLAKKFDDSGTYHTGGAAQYSAATGLRTSLGFRDNEEGLPSYNPNDNIDNQFGTGFGYVERGDQTISAVSTMAQSLGTMLDGVAVAFGENAGYAVATAFADDTSKDGAWGALRISKDGQELLNWEDTRQSKWAPREFGDGEEGYNQYLAAVAKDTRQVLLDMDLPSWADTMLESIGDAASMDQLAATVQQIGVIQTTFVQLGKTMEGFAGLTDQAFEALMRASGGFESLAANAGTYYENFYSEAEKTAAVTRSVSESLAQVGLAMPATRDEFRALVESQLALGESGAEAVAALLGVSGAFASVTESAADAQKRLEEERQQQLQQQANAAKSARDSAYSALENAITREREAIDVQRSLAAESVDTLTGIFETIRSNVRELYSEVDGTDAMQVSQANAFIDNALRTAQTTGYMPDGAALSEAIGTARGGLSSGAYTSQFEADRDRLVLAGKLSALGEITGEQLTTAERQLKYSQEQIEQLDQTLDYWREQIDIASGTYQATLSVAEAIGKLQALMFPDAAKPASASGIATGVTFGGGATPVAEAANGGRVAGGKTADGYVREFYSGFGSSFSSITDATEVARLDSVYALAQQFSGTGDVAGLIGAAKDSGASLGDLATVLGYRYEDVVKAAGSLGIPAFAVGTNYVPRDMLAKIHKGEAIVPKAYNPWANGQAMQGGDPELLAEMRAMRAELAALRAAASATANNTAAMPQMADQFDTVTNGGNAMRAKALA